MPHPGWRRVGVKSRGEYLKAMGIEVWMPRDAAEQPPAEPADSPPSLEDLERRVSGCRQCELHASRTHTVFGAGNPSAEWMFVGEAPGAEEDRRGLPFVGRAGQLLNAMLGALGLTRDQVYIANVLKCRPPNNRDPQGAEVEQCEPYLHQQVARIRPKIIVAMGRFAAQSLLKTSRPIGKLRGEQFSYSDTGIPLVVTYHPAYLMRNPIDKRKAWEDLLFAREVSSRL
jgi:DNA polymerase